MMTTVIHANDHPIVVTVHRQGELNELKAKLRLIYNHPHNVMHHEFERIYSLMFKISMQDAHEELNR